MTTKRGRFRSPCIQRVSRSEKTRSRAHGATLAICAALSFGNIASRFGSELMSAIVGSPGFSALGRLHLGTACSRHGDEPEYGHTSVACRSAFDTHVLASVTSLALGAFGCQSSCGTCKN